MFLILKILLSKIDNGVATCRLQASNDPCDD